MMVKNGRLSPNNLYNKLSHLGAMHLDKITCNLHLATCNLSFGGIP